jgi:hypothetical protein
MICIKPCAPAGETALGLPLDSTAMIAAISADGTLCALAAASISGFQR